MSDASTSPLETALTELIHAYETGAARPDDDPERRAAFEATFALARSLPKRKELKADLAPVAKRLASSPDPRSWLPEFIAQPADHPLHRAASALLAKRVWTYPVLASVSPRGLPKRWIKDLLLARGGDVAYAAENPARVSVWSLGDGTHVEDLALPGIRGDVNAQLTELADGTLRAITRAFSNGACGLFERSPGEAAFRVLAKPVARSSACAHTRGFEWVLFAPPPTAGGPDVPTTTFRLVEAATGKPRRLELPFVSFTNSVPIDEHRVVLRVDLPPEREDDAARPALMLVDLAKGTHESFACPVGANVVETTGDPAVVTLLVRDDSEGCLDFDTRTRAFGARRAQDTSSLTATGVAFAQGRYQYRAHEREVRDAHGVHVGSYRPEDDPFNVVCAYDAARDRLVVAGNDPAVPVALVAVYDPAAATA